MRMAADEGIDGGCPDGRRGRAASAHCNRSDGPVASRGHVSAEPAPLTAFLVASASRTREALLHDTATGAGIGTPITVPEGQENQVRLSLDGRWLALGGERGADGSRHGYPFQLWDLEPDQWVAAACRVAGRNLTRDEWNAHIGDLAPYRATCPELPSDG